MSDYQTSNYEEQGGAVTHIGGDLDIESGGEIDVESGAEIDIESGASFKIAGTAVTSSAAELNIMDGVTSTTAELNILDGVTSTTAELNILDGVTATYDQLNFCDVTAGTAAASKAVVLGADAQLDVQTSIPAGASVGHIIKQTGVAGGTYTGTNAGLQIKNYDADNTVVHSGGENAGLAIWLKALSEPTAGGEYALLTAHMHGSSTGTIKYGGVFYGDFTNGLCLSGGTSTNGLFFDNQTVTNFASFAAGAEARVASTYCDTSANTNKSDGAIRILVGSTEYFIPIYAAGNTDNSW